MIAVDTNILVYAHRQEVPQHPAAKNLLRDLASGQTRWAIPWPCCYEFFGIVTHRRIWKEAASTPQQAWAQLEAWAGSPALSLLGESGDFMPVLKKYTLRPRVSGPVVHDARVAAICAAHGVEELLTADRDFSLFPELRIRNPFY